MPQRVKQATEHATRLDKPVDNGKRVNTKQVMDSYRSGAYTRLRHHPFVPSQYRGGRPWVRGKKGYGLAMGRRGKPTLRCLLKVFWEKYLVGITYHPKEVKIS